MANYSISVERSREHFQVVPSFGKRLSWYEVVACNLDSYDSYFFWRQVWYKISCLSNMTVHCWSRKSDLYTRRHLVTSCDLKRVSRLMTYNISSFMLNFTRCSILSSVFLQSPTYIYYYYYYYYYHYYYHLHSYYYYFILWSDRWWGELLLLWDNEP